MSGRGRAADVSAPSLRIPADEITAGARLLRAEALDAIGHHSDGPVPEKKMNEFVRILWDKEREWVEARGVASPTRHTKFGTFDPKGPNYGWNTMQFDTGEIAGVHCDSPEEAALSCLVFRGDQPRLVWSVADHRYAIHDRYSDARRKKSDPRIFEVTDGPVEHPVQIIDGEPVARKVPAPEEPTLFGADWLVSS